VVNWLIYKGLTPFTLGPGNTKNFGGDGDFDLGRVRISLRYNEGDRIKHSSEPIWETDFTGVPVAQGHDPCGYWWRGPFVETCGLPVAPVTPIPQYGTSDYFDWEWSPWFTMPYYTTPPDTTPAPTTDPCANPAPLVFASGATSLPPDSSANLNISGGVPPYDWELIDATGSGFSLDWSKTAAPLNTWRTSASACGSVTIKVTDYCGDTLEIPVKSTVGNWTVVVPWSAGCWCSNPNEPPDLNCCHSCDSEYFHSGYYTGSGVYCFTNVRTRYEAHGWKGHGKCCVALPGQECEWHCSGFCPAWDALASSWCGAGLEFLGGMLLEQWTC
jgi:hypothetical protein